MIEQWDIQKSQGRCAGTDRKLEPGEEYVAALIDSKTSFERRDYSVEYWNSSQPKVFSYWKTRIPEPTQKKKLLVDDHVLINFFERLADEQDELKLRFRFVLTLILMRKRLIKYEQSIKELDKEIWQVRLMSDKSLHQVVNPQLEDDQIEQVSQELSVILQGGL